MVSSSQVEGKSATYGGRNSKRRGPFPLTFAALACLCRPLEVHSKARTNGQDHRSAADVDAAARAGRDELFDGRDVVVVAERAGTFVLAAVRARGRRLRQSQARLREQVVERPAGAGLGRTTPLDGDRSRRRLALGTSTWHPAAGPRSSRRRRDAISARRRARSRRPLCRAPPRSSGRSRGSDPARRRTGRRRASARRGPAPAPARTQPPGRDIPRNSPKRRQHVQEHARPTLYTKETAS